MPKKPGRVRKILRKPPIRKIGRKLRGLIKECENCGAKRQEIFKMYSFKGGKEKVHFYCRKCYAKLISGRKLEEF
jgi:hypothetical protein